MLPPPSRPVVGVGAVVVRDGRVLMVKRGKEPLRGRWTLPGGTVELGETLEEAVVRELQEETGLSVTPRELLALFDRIHREAGRVAYHFVIADYLCDYVTGELRAGSDAEAVAFVAPAEFGAYEVPEKACELALEGLRRAAGGVSPR